jgi:hypothetical protein
VGRSEGPERKRRGRAVRPTILTTTTIGGGRRMRKNASVPAHTFDQAETPTGSGGGGALKESGEATEWTRDRSPPAALSPAARRRGGRRSARGSIAATGARFTPRQSAREGLGGQVARGLRRPSETLRGTTPVTAASDAAEVRVAVAKTVHREEVLLHRGRCAAPFDNGSRRDGSPLLTPVKPVGGHPDDPSLWALRTARGRRCHP